jgi:hypothetical protein
MYPVGIVRSRTQTMEFSLVFSFTYALANDLKMQTLTANRQTRPLVREGAPQIHNNNRQQ